MKQPIGVVLFAVASIVFASLLIRFSETGPIVSGAYRLLFTIPMLLLINVVTTPKMAKRQKLSKEVVIFALLAGLFFALDLAVYNISILYTSLAEATLLTNMAPFIIAPISIIFLKEKISPKFLIAVILSIIGLYLLMGKNEIDARHLNGDWLALLSALFYALFLTTIKKAAANYSVNQVMIIVCSSGGAILFIIAWFANETLLPQSIWGWFILIAIAVSGQLFGQTLLAYGIKFLPLQLGSLFLLLSPIFAAIYAYIAFHETLNLVQITGMGIILAAIYLGKNILQHKK